MTPANQFARALQLAFSKRSAAAPFHEVEQFRALKDSFATLRPMFPVEEYHGFKRQVYFDTSKSWLRSRARCELSDLLLLTYATNGRPQIRLTLLQAKLSRLNHSSLCSARGPHTPTEFHANYEQWDLLSTRPRLDPTKVFTPPPDLLTSAIVPSIGSFGVFHRTKAGAIDMFYASADTLQAVGSPASRYGRLSTTVGSSIRKYGGFVDSPFSCCLFEFGRALHMLRIGTPVMPNVTSGGSAAADPIAKFVGDMLRGYQREVGENSIIAGELLDVLGYPSDTAEPIDTLPSIVIVKGRTSPDDE